MDELVTRFYALFRGSPYARGVSTCTPKVEGKKKPPGGYTAHTQAEVSHWRSHLAGDTGLGIFPATDIGTSWFAAVDLDDYKMDKPAIVRKVHALDIGAIPCNSKSGGLHVYCFFDGVRTADIRAFMAHVAFLIGYPQAEIFPKQDESKPTHPGNWINMPYFGTSDRHGLFYDMKPLTSEQFLMIADASRQSAARLYLNSMKLALGGPKCIVDVFRNGTIFGDGVRHEMRKKYVAYLMDKDVEDKEETCLWFADLVTPGDPHDDVLES